ncbi:MAG: hypothetical protein H0W07_09075 [Chloroflexi bacterium]|nr:hypothetical protein [Chloroflexota bacterium]
MRLLAAEILKIRRRWATYVLESLLLGLMLLVFVLVGIGPRPSGVFGSPFAFPQVYGVVNQFVFGLGSLLAVAFAGAIGGADFTWGVLRVVVARGESRARYILTKAAAIGLFVCGGVVIAFVAGILLTYLLGAMQGSDAGNPITGQSGRDLTRSLALGLPVILERAAIGFAVAVVLRSQIAGIVAGIVLQIGEGIVSLIIIAVTFASRFDPTNPEAAPNLGPIGPEWFQYLPFSIGESVLAEAPQVTQGASDFVLNPVPLTTALIVTFAYLAAALALSALRVERAEITS